ncbi:response regulator [Acetobacter fabarum]|uniref:sigma-54-dependent transcriptional regulator n=1 Tax=Acetobacter fabarum TaxID=483199 RepID=UPI0014052658|nr:sigma-54 dependent transcriptional regulator [Acetobacter fabarum]MCH4026395.1 sigma-54 dependent transcriptional regulator [Acetobacter fabarum]MCH4055764.1 sigma-54 dependent transcriptional regulator [Acetobacter fabarum]MCH4085743.1 sigma-54 dependent transcriptional regulator [Acetobacter fabarum]MCH4128291.1 sigma-54 dependent transcriptional regulator [Acetobacter fabarum]MCH4137014.1 sigma-54 dependent transcriptional regulator [Acetobacter fabarum]
MVAPACILVVDDEPRSVEVIARILREDFEVLSATSVEQARALLENNWVHAIFCDQRMPGMSGVEFLAEVRARWPDIVRMIVTGYTEPDDMIDAINQAGIYQYITKPWHPDQLLLAARNATQLFAMQREYERLSLELRLAPPVVEGRLRQQRERVAGSYHFDSIIRSPASPMCDVCRQAAKTAVFDIPVLIEGETGTGKELLARAVHYASQRSAGAFVAVNCGAIPDDLLESELFGHRKGAFTGAHANRRGLVEEADGGTLFLDEIGDISPAFQVKILRFLQEGEFRPLGTNETTRVDVRVLAATHRDLRAEVRAGRFREDLYFRLTGMVLSIPPLRSRPADIHVLAQHLLDAACARHGRHVRGFAPGVMDVLVRYAWPGNVRELQNEILRMLVLAESDCLGLDLLSPMLMGVGPVTVTPQAPLAAEPTVHDSGTLQERMDALEADVLMETIARCGWNKSLTARELGLSRVGLRAKLERYGIVPDAGKQSLQKGNS